MLMVQQRGNLKRSAAAALMLLAALAPAPRAQAAQYMLVQHHQPNRLIDLVEIGQQGVVHRDEEGTLKTAALEQCVALFDPDASITVRRRGVVVLADGQRLPGEAISGEPTNDRALVWNHKMLGRMQIPLKRIESVVFSDGASPPPPGVEDVVLLANGDRLEGLITALGDPLVLEVRSDAAGAQTRPVEIRLDRVAAVTMVNAPQKPRGQRLWLIDGTIYDVGNVLLGDDRLVRLIDPPLITSAAPDRLTLFSVAAVLFQPGNLTALADLSPARLEGPATRYVLPKPQAVGGSMPLGLRDLEMHGPLSVKYALPRSPARFIAEVSLPSSARQWGDCELIISDDGNVVFRAALNANAPAASIDAALRGSSMTIQIAEGANGPIQDTLVFKRAMFITQSP